MVKLSIFEELKDKANRLIPTAYMEIVEECTSESIRTPPYEHLMLLCNTAQNRAEQVPDILRAIRRRIDHKNPHVQYLVVLVLDHLVKNCGTVLHAELASQRGLLRDLVNIATIRPAASKASSSAKTAALGLIANMSIWFASHPDPQCYALRELADDVREALGPNAFEGIRPDTNVQTRYGSGPSHHAPNSRHGKTSRPATRRSTEQDGGGRSGQSRYRCIVTAIPLIIPSEGEISTMLESCLVLAEYLNNAEAAGGGKVHKDEVIIGLMDKIQQDREQMQTVLLGGMELPNMDVYLSVLDSQNAILDRTTAAVGDGGSGSNVELRGTVAQAPQMPQLQQQTQPPPHIPSSAQTNDTVVTAQDGSAASVAPGTTRPVQTLPLSVPEAKAQPSVDELFGGLTTVASPPPSAAEAVVTDPPPAAVAPATETRQSAVMEEEAPAASTSSGKNDPSETQLPVTATEAAATAIQVSGASGVAEASTSVPQPSAASESEAVAILAGDAPAPTPSVSDSTKKAANAKEDMDEFEAFLSKRLN